MRSHRDSGRLKEVHPRKSGPAAEESRTGRKIRIPMIQAVPILREVERKKEDNGGDIPYGGVGISGGGKLKRRSQRI